MVGPEKGSGRLLSDQAHAGDPGLGLLKLGDVYFDDLEPAPSKPFGGSRVAGRENEKVTGPQAVRGGRFPTVDGHGFDAGELGRIDASRVVDEDWSAALVRPCESRSGLQVKAVLQFRLDDVEADLACDLAEGVNSLAIRAARQPDVQSVADAKHVATVDMALPHAVQSEMLPEAGGGGLCFRGPGRGSRAKDDGIAIE